MRSAIGADEATLRRVAVVGSVVRANEVHENCWVLCASTELSAAASGGKSCCVEITDPAEFFATVGNALRMAVRQPLEHYGYRVQYRSRRADGSEFGMLSAPFIKPQSFTFESEVRGVWIGSSVPELPFVDLVVPDLTRFIRQVSVPVS